LHSQAAAAIRFLIGRKISRPARDWNPFGYLKLTSFGHVTEVETLQKDVIAGRKAEYTALYDGTCPTYQGHPWDVFLRAAQRFFIPSLIRFLASALMWRFLPFVVLADARVGRLGLPCNAAMA
jgi:hypothetical protein